MGVRFNQLWKLVIAFTLLLGLVAVAIAFAEAPVKNYEPKGVAQQCLKCHHPSYDKIREATAKFKTPGGVTVNPHQYIPHKEKTVIPDCTECHEAHGMGVKAIKPKEVTFCYTACHHMNNFDPCTKCHG
jgi:hypothetical protein